MWVKGNTCTPLVGMQVGAVTMENSMKVSQKIKNRTTISSVAQSCPTLCDPMNRSTPGLPVHHQLLEFTQTHAHWVSDAISSSVVPFSSCPQSLPASGSFPMTQLFAWGGQSIGVSASASVLPMNTQDLSPWGWTGWISLQSKRLSSIFSNTTVQNYQWSSNSTPGYLSKENETINSKRYMELFITALFIIAKIWKQPVSINGWMDKENDIYMCIDTYDIVLSNHKKGMKSCHL